MKIEEIFPNDYIKVKRRSPINQMPWRMMAKRTLVLVAGALMCVGSFYYGHESNRIAMEK